MKIAVTVLTCLLFLGRGVAFGFSDIYYQNLISDFFVVMAGKPTVRDVGNYGGPETEFQFEMMICKERNWTPENSSSKCISFTKERRINDTSHSSFYLLWLRSKLPKSQKFEIVSVDDALLSDYPYTEIVVLVDKVEIVFGHDRKRGPYGFLFVLHIDGVSVDSLLRTDINNGFTPSIY